MSRVKAFINNQRVQRVLYFFPFRLFILHLRSNHMLLFFWLLLMAIATGNFGNGYGVPYLLWDPEYMGRVDFWSYLLLGFSFGGFMMAFNISSYIMNASKFPFLATLNRPFFKYSINNFIIPSIFMALYLWHMVQFQSGNQLYANADKLAVRQTLIWDILGFLIGIGLFSIPAHTYFFATTRNVFKHFGISVDDENHVRTNRPMAKPIKLYLEKSYEWRSVSGDTFGHEWKVLTYLAQPWQIGLARDTDHYDRTMLRKVFEQNHMAAAIFELVVFVSFIGLGAFREVPQLTLPAGAVLMLTCTFLLMLSSFIHSRLRGWSTTFIIALVVVVHLIVKNGWLEYRSQAYGLTYQGLMAPYDLDTITAMNSDKAALASDLLHHTNVLNNWRSRIVAKPWDKPRLLMICVTGGGARSAMWAFRTLQLSDSVLQGRVLKHAHMITGASGGMYGAAYLRELGLRAQTDSSVHLHDPKLADDVAKDLLNPIATSLVLNDLFIRYQKFKDGPDVYTKDRGYALEREFNNNTHEVLHKRLRDYFGPEAKGQIPLMVFAPTIINDGRMLIVATQPMAHITYNHPDQLKGVPTQGAVEFRRLFSAQGADRLWFTTALRMNSTFPYISPAIGLPSEPEVEVMDAGFYDTYGIQVAARHLYHMRQWINENTSGVVILQVRDSPKITPFVEHSKRTLIDMISDPVGNIYQNMFNMQDYDNDQMLNYIQEWMTVPFDVVDMELWCPETESISLSWHLTAKEKARVRESAYRWDNLKAIERLDSLLQ
jgi:hypothetical protein